MESVRPPDGLSDLGLRDVERAVGSGSFDRGRRYARQGAVARWWWDADDPGLLQGEVYGSAPMSYETDVYLLRAPGMPPEYSDSQCTCPVGVDCKHAVALLVTAIDAELTTQHLPDLITTPGLLATPQHLPVPRRLPG